MNTERIEIILKDTWLKEETWHTNHPSDEKRFHKAIEKVFLKDKYNLDSDTFERAINNVLNSPVNFQDEINLFSERADRICSFLFDIKD